MAKPVPTPIVPNVPASSLGQIIREHFVLLHMYTHNDPLHNLIGLEVVKSFLILLRGSQQISCYFTNLLSSENHASREMQGHPPDIT